MKTSESLSNLASALLKAHQKIKHAQKNAKNPHFRNDYATLESVIDASKEALLEQGIVVLQAPNGASLTTRLQHSSGEYIETELNLLLTKQDMQGLGSAITYARRYSLAALLNMAQADDDGNEASKAATKKLQKLERTEKIGDVSVTTKTTVVKDSHDF